MGSSSTLAMPLPHSRRLRKLLDSVAPLCRLDQPGRPAGASARQRLASAAATHASLAPRMDPGAVPTFGPGERAGAAAFFHAYGFCLLEEAHSPSDVQHLNAWYERSQRTRPFEWGCQHGADKEWMYHQPLLEYEELDRYVRHSGHYPLVATLLGGEEHARLSEFDFRDTPSDGRQDRSSHPAFSRFTEDPRMAQNLFLGPERYFLSACGSLWEMFLAPPSSWGSES
jgi:hypothetical protein